MARKSIEWGKDNWYGDPVHVYLEDDGTYTFEYGPSGNLTEVKKGLTKEAAMKMLKDKTNGPRYNSACNSTNPVVANAMRASGGVARNATAFNIGTFASRLTRIVQDIEKVEDEIIAAMPDEIEAPQEYAKIERELLVPIQQAKQAFRRF